MISIRDCFELYFCADFFHVGENYSIFKNEIAEYYISEEQTGEFGMVVPEFSLQRRPFKGAFTDKYDISGLFDLGPLNFSRNTNRLLVLAKPKGCRPKERVKIAHWRGDPWPCPGAEAIEPSVDALYASVSSDYLNYLSSIEGWINGDSQPKDSDCAEFVLLGRDNIDPEHLRPSFYRGSARALRKSLRKEETKKLSEVADVIKARPIYGTEVDAMVVTPASCKYPFDYEKVRPSFPTSEKVRKGDLLISSMGTKKPYLFDHEPKAELYVSSSWYIVRSREVTPEYLYFFLASETARDLVELLAPGFQRRLSFKDLVNLPVIVPQKKDVRHVRLFDVMTREVDDIGKVHSVNAALLSTSSQQEELTAEDIFDIECARRMRTYHTQLVKEFLEGDIAELNACFSVGAYKATMIMAGSILEAVLIDWLSELDGKNYFEVDLMVPDWRRGEGFERRADLIDYIRRIKEIEVPPWMEEDKAHYIRKKRNNIHAKLCMKSDDVNEETCLEVINYLNDVIRSRGAYQ